MAKAKKSEKTKTRQAKASKAKTRKSSDQSWDAQSRLSTEEKVMAPLALSEDLQDAWVKLKGFALGLGEQRNYAAGKAVMFSKKVCYLFVRPQARFLEVVVFLSDGKLRPGFHKVQAVTRTKWAHTYKVVHADQVEGNLTDAIQQAFQICPSSSTSS